MNFTTGNRKFPTVLRITRHDFLREQREYLKARIGEFNAVEWRDTVNPAVMRELAETVRPDYVEVVLPLPLLEEALRIFKPARVIRSVMQRRVNTDTGESSNTFVKYEEILEVRVNVADFIP